MFSSDNDDLGFSNRFDHVLFGELPSSSFKQFPYNGKRIYMKPDLFGFDLRNVYSTFNNIESSIKDFGQNLKCQYLDAKSKVQCAKLTAFKRNMDLDVYKTWRDILTSVIHNSDRREKLRKRAVKYGIREMNKQAKQLQTMRNEFHGSIGEFRKLLIEKYGEHDLEFRKGREIIFTTSGLLKTSRTCTSPNEIKCHF